MACVSCVATFGLQVSKRSTAAYVSPILTLTAIALLLFGLIGYFAIPAGVRWGIETVASRELGRAVHVESQTGRRSARRTLARVGQG